MPSTEAHPEDAVDEQVRERRELVAAAPAEDCMRSLEAEWQFAGGAPDVRKHAAGAHEHTIDEHKRAKNEGGKLAEATGYRTPLRNG